MPNEQDITHSYIIDYIRESTKKNTGFLSELEDYAHENSVPIIQSEVASFLKVMLLTAKPKRILEVGCAIGYSALLMSEYMPKGGKIITIERDENMAKLARENIKKAGKEDIIEVIEADAEEFLPQMQGSFDMIFMDASKAHYIHFLPHCLRMLEEGGLLISDNVLYGGMVANRALLIRRKITIVKRLKKYIDAICHSDELETSILSIGDGVSVSYKKGKDEAK